MNFISDTPTNLSQLQEAKQLGKRIGFTCSTFDLLHSGHCDMLTQAARECDILVVGLLSDPTIDRKEKNKPVQAMFERWTQLHAIRVVDMILPYDTEEDLLNLLHVIKPDVRILGNEYTQKKFTGCALDMDYVFNTRTHNYSTSSLRNRVEEAK